MRYKFKNEQKTYDLYEILDIFCDMNTKCENCPLDKRGDLGCFDDNWCKEKLLELGIIEEVG